MHGVGLVQSAVLRENAGSIVCPGTRVTARALGCRKRSGLGATPPHLALSRKKRPSIAEDDSSRTVSVDSFGRGVTKECYLVDPASSHMLVSKIKPCTCKYELIQTVKLRMAH